MSLRLLLPSLALFGLLAACGGHVRETPADAGTPDGGDLETSPPGSDPDGAITPDASPVHGVAWVTPLPGAGVPYRTASDGAGGALVGTYQAVAARVSDAGTPLWSVDMTSLWGGSSRNFLGGIAADAHGNAIVGGDGLTLLAAADGHPLWNVAFQGTIDTRGVTVLGDGSIVQVGFVYDSATFGSTELSGAGYVGYFLHFDADGNALTIRLMSDLMPNESWPFGAATDENGNLVLELGGGDGPTDAVTFDHAMNVLHSTPIGAGIIGNSFFAAAPGDAAFVSNTDLTTGDQNVMRISPTGAVAWTFRPPASFLVPSALTTVVPDGASGAVAWVDTVWSIDASGAGTEIVPVATLTSTIDAKLGQPGWYLYGSLPPHPVLGTANDVLLVGSISSGQTGGDTATFVARLQR